MEKFLTFKNSKMIILACCAICLLFFFLPMVDVMGKGSISMLDCLTEIGFGDAWWAILFLIGPAVGGYLAFRAEELKPIPGVCLIVPALIFFVAAAEGLSFAGLGYVYLLVAIVATGVPFVSPNKKA